MIGRRATWCILQWHNNRDLKVINTDIKVRFHTMLAITASAIQVYGTLKEGWV